MLTEEIRNSFLQVLEEGVKPATGCTEPVAVAYAAAVCRCSMPHIFRRSPYRSNKYTGVR